jgi:FkbM family methyltransferase
MSVTQSYDFVSYAQNGEDFLLWRMLYDVKVGSYFDIGAFEPEIHSVTQAFYERGWSGINVEPVARHCRQLRRRRPRDVNLQIAIAAARGERDFFRIEDTGLSTLDRATAERHLKAGYRVRQASITVRTLCDVWDEFVQGDVHFLKIDVEGAEAEVLAGAALTRQRPWIIVIEATAPLTLKQTHAQWEPALTQARYRLAHVDRINRYYVAEEHAVLAERLRMTGGGRRFVRAGELVALRPDLPAAARFDPTSASFLGSEQPTPSLREPTSQLCTESQMREAAYSAWCEVLAEPPVLHRKQWEFVYVLRVLDLEGLLVHGSKGLGFGCTRQPLPAVLASRGCEIVATDFNGEIVSGDGHRCTLDELNQRCLCDPELFGQRVSFRAEDMKSISRDLQGFDFLWSTGAFERLGSIRRGLEFVINAMRCLKPGGLAVHTTEFNLSSNRATIDTDELVVFRRCDIEALASELVREGHSVATLNFNPGSGPVDRYVDLPPYHPEPHLRLRLDQYVLTSLGLIVRRKA